MTTAVDTNVIAALWDADAELSGMANHALDQAMARGRLVISAPVFAELMAMPRRNEAFLDGFLRDTRISVDWDLDESIWRTAGRAFRPTPAASASGGMPDRDRSLPISWSGRMRLSASAGSSRSMQGCIGPRFPDFS